MAAKKKTIKGRGDNSRTYQGKGEANKGRSVKKKGSVIGKLDKPVDTKKYLAYVVGNEVRMVERKPRGKSKRVGCSLRNKPNKAGGTRRVNRAGGSRKMTKAEVSSEFARSFMPYLHDDAAVRTAWNDHVDVLHKSGLVSSAVANSSVPAKFLKRKSNRTGGKRPAHRSYR